MKYSRTFAICGLVLLVAAVGFLSGFQQTNFNGFGNSSLSSPLTLGTFNATSQYQLNGAQITSAALSDAATLCAQNNANGIGCTFNFAPVFGLPGFNVSGTIGGQANVVGSTTMGGSVVWPPCASGTCTITSNELVNIFSGNRKIITTADFTDANSAALQAITGLSWTLAANSTYSFRCVLTYSQATPSAGDQFGIGILTTAPVSASVTAAAYTNTGAAAPVTTGILTALGSTTPTAAVTFTPAVATPLRAEIDGGIETGNGASTFNIYVLNGTAANLIVVKKDASFCVVN